MTGIQEILVDLGLFRSVSKIMIDYLTDPPVLPYLVELDKITRNIRNDEDWCYDNYYVKNGLWNGNAWTGSDIGSKINYKCKHRIISIKEFIAKKYRTRVIEVSIK